jgi:hypothetical protein
MTATGACTIEPIECAKNTPFPSGAIIEYATNRSSPTVATDGGGRLQPAELTSVVSTATALAQLLPESAELAIRSAALLSRRTFHHAENMRPLPGIVRSDVVQSPGEAGGVVTRARSATAKA